jgi:aminoglycoside phosphotransferase (APT) family kinase protein
MEPGASSQAGLIRRLVTARLPGYRVRSVARLAEGQENVAYEVNGELIVRFSKEPDPVRRAARVDREARLLAAVASISPLPVPEPELVAAEAGCLAYRKLPGLPLPDLPHQQLAPRAAQVAAVLGTMLAALHAVPVERLADLVGTDDQPLDGWRDDAGQDYRDTASVVPAARRGAIGTFLAAPPPPGPGALVFSHNDLGIEHVLADPRTWAVTGILDWGDAAITDPAYDIGLLYRDLGPAALDAVIGGYPAGPADAAALRERAVFYARCSALEDLAYGLRTGQRTYADRSLAALGWLFPA